MKDMKLAQRKLIEHKIKGKNSDLNIFEVAKLMDTIKKISKSNQDQKLFNYCLN
tara:strand:- start:16356 stop:16517 length:162 start_codon:yes stop_codon:yes gene_type:complete